MKAVVLMLVIAVYPHLAGCQGSVQHLSPYEEQGRFGYRDRAGRVSIQPQYMMAGEFSDEGLAAVLDSDGWAYIDRQGRVVIRPYVFDNGPDYFSEGLARFSIDGKFGFFNSYGEVVIGPSYDFAYPFSEGLAAVCSGCSPAEDGEHILIKGGRFGYIDRHGNAAIPLRYDEARPFRGGKADVMLDSVWSCIDLEGQDSECD